MSETTPTGTPSPGGDPPSPVPRKRVNRRERILRTAAEVFAAQGFNNTSLADIAATLDITPAGVLHHFGSKTELLTAVLELRDTNDPAPSGAGMLDHLVTTAERNAARPGTTRLYAVLSAESATARHPAQDWFRDRYTVLRREVEEAVLDRIGPEHREMANTRWSHPRPLRGHRDPGRDGRPSGAVVAGPGVGGHGHGHRAGDRCPGRPVAHDGGRGAFGARPDLNALDGLASGQTKGRPRCRAPRTPLVVLSRPWGGDDRASYRSSPWTEPGVPSVVICASSVSLPSSHSSQDFCQ